MLSAPIAPPGLKSQNVSEKTDSTKQTEASGKEHDLSFETNSAEESDSFTIRSLSQEHITLKLQLLTRTGMKLSRISLLSNYTPRNSALWSISSQWEVGGYTPKLAYAPSVRVRTFLEEFWRPDSEIREEYISKLKAQQIMDLKTQKRHQTLVIIDWDGTLFCGSDLGEIKGNVNSTEDKETLKLLDETASNLLSKAIEYCSPFIITSYNESLVESRARIFLPLTSELMHKNKIKIVSTSHYEVSPHQNGKEHQGSWQGFLFEKEKLESDVGTNIMCMVDSQTKIDMISVLAGHFEKPIVKIVKFKEFSKVKEVIKQQKLLIREFENILFS